MVDSNGQDEELSEMCNPVAKKLAAIASAAVPIDVEHSWGGTFKALPIPVEVIDQSIEELNKLDSALNEVLAFVAVELKMPETAEALKRR